MGCVLKSGANPKRAWSETQGDDTRETIGDVKLYLMSQNCKTC